VKDEEPAQCFKLCSQTSLGILIFSSGNDL